MKTCRHHQRDQERGDTAGSHAAGFTLLELLVVIGIIGLLASLLMSGLNDARQAALSTSCKSNLRQVGLGLQMFIQDNGHFPIRPYVPPPSRGIVSGNYFEDPIPKAFRGLVSKNGFTTSRSHVFSCPSDRPERSQQFSRLKIYRPPSNYGYNAYGYGGLVDPPVRLGLSAVFLQINTHPGVRELAVSVDSVPIPGEMIAFGDAVGGYLLRPYGGFSPSTDSVRFSHARKANVLFLDGHVRGLSAENLLGDSVLARSRWNNDHEPHYEIVRPVAVPGVP